ncbi:hypothetical protein FRX31_015356 [Thalictrum thalictroides]|uniref:Uncharacterized protein n=1 Tax=Thalictrum thalictroides TaxID=46969 RepID=A0A7J6WDV5_THATH|nr:hypothetical protein FRX31_015356 [Thalictrum thalictroides]
MGFPEKNSKLLVPPSSGDNYFSQQAIRAGMLTSELRRPELMVNPDPSRELILMELEKERIREQIIASEIMRIRELEDEFRRKQAMERELALRRGDGQELKMDLTRDYHFSEILRLLKWLVIALGTISDPGSLVTGLTHLDVLIIYRSARQDT